VELKWLAIGVMVVALFTIPLGFPGAWVMVGMLAIGLFTREVGSLALVTALALATIAEVIEFFVVKRLTAKYGGSRAAFWGALVGGFAGVFIGLPIPLIGSIVAGFAGSFAGAALVTLWQTKQFDLAHRVGWGVVIGRTISAAVKTAAGVIIVVIGAAAFLT